EELEKELKHAISLLNLNVWPLSVLEKRIHKLYAKARLALIRELILRKNFNPPVAELPELLAITRKDLLELKKKGILYFPPIDTPFNITALRILAILETKDVSKELMAKINQNLKKINRDAEDPASWA